MALLDPRQGFRGDICPIGEFGKGHSGLVPPGPKIRTDGDHAEGGGIYPRGLRSGHQAIEVVSGQDDVRLPPYFHRFCTGNPSCPC